MTKEEYMAHTNIKSVEEAAQYLRNLHIFFVVASIGVLVNWIFVDYIDRPIRL